MNIKNKEMPRLIVGNGILDQMKELPEPITLKVEDLYENFPSEHWSILDKLLENRPDLQDRIEKYKKGRRCKI